MAAFSLVRARWLPVFLPCVLLLLALLALAAERVDAAGFDEAARLLASLEEAPTFEGQQWITGTPERVWVLDVASREVVGFEAGGEATEEIAEERVLPGGARVSKTGVRRVAQTPRRVAVRDLPEKLSPLGSSASILGERAEWLLDREASRAWKWQGEHWSEPLLLGEPIGGAVADRAGALLVNTPSHPQFAFAYYDSEGQLRRRFGERLPSAHEGQAEQLNTWSLSTLRGDGWLAFHRFRPLARAYAAGGELRWEKQLEAPNVARLERARIDGGESVVPVGDSEGCISCRAIHFATHVAPVPKETFLVHFSAVPALDRFDSEGRWLESVQVGQSGSPAPWQPFGFIASGQNLFAVERGQLVVYRSDSGAEFEGRVVARDLEPVAGALVRVLTRTGQTWQLETDAAGRFAIPAILPSAAGRIDVRAEGYLHAEWGGVLAELLAEPLTLEAAPRQCVRVVAEASGRPVERFRVEVVRQPDTWDRAGWIPGPAQVVEDSEGRACLDAPWLPPWRLRVDAEGYANAEIRIEAPPGSGDDPLLVELGPEARLEIEVTEAMGEPVQGAKVLVDLATASGLARALPDAWTGETDETGAARLVGFEPTAYRVDIAKEGYLPWSERVELEPGVNPVQVELSQGSRLDVGVSDEAGQPVSGARVSVVSGARAAGRLACETDDTGRCTVHAVPPGRHRARAVADGYTGGFATAVVGPDHEHLQLDIVVREGVRLSGVVRGIEEYPGQLLAVRVSAPGFATETTPVDEQGRFAFAAAPTGRVSLQVEDRDRYSRYLLRVLEVPRGVWEHEVVLELPTPLRVFGQVTRGGSGCASCEVRFSQIGAELARPVRSAATRPDGSYEVKLPAAGAYQVEVLGEDGQRAGSRIVSIVEEERVDLALDRRRVRGRVTTAGGEAASGARVEIFDSWSGQSLASTSTDVDGRFRIGSLPAEPLHLTVIHGEATVSTRLESDSDEPLDLVLPAEQTIRLRLVDGLSGLPVGSASVLIAGDSGEILRHRRLIADPEGILRVPAPSTRPASLVVSAPNYALEAVSGVQLSTDPLLLALDPRRRSFTVEVRPEAGPPCSFQLVSATGPAALSPDFPPGPVPFSHTSALFNNVEPGSYTAVLGTCDGQWYTAPAVLEPGSTPHLVFPPEG